MADQDLEVGLGFSGSDDGARELLRLMLGELRQLRAENKAALAEDQAASAARRAANAAERAATLKARAERQQTLTAERTAARAAAQARRDQATAERQAANAQLAAAAAALKESAALRSSAGAAAANVDVVGTLGRRLAALASGFAAGLGITAFIRQGLQFNQTIESATLGIGSLISAQATLTDANGKTLQGEAALAGGLRLARDQVRELRIAGLQTAATTLQLVEAFQQAVGAGVAAGLELDQIRKLTVGIVQAAGALAVPMDQLNQEVRSILDGTIDRNSRVAKALNITNEDIAKAKAAGNLFGFLEKRLQAFGTAGVAVAQTYAGVLSNLAESIQTFAGESTTSLFEATKQIAGDTITRLFDTANLKVSDQFQGLADFLNEIAGRLGTLAGEIVSALLDGAAQIGRFFSENRVEVETFLQEAQNLLEAVGHVVGSLVSFIGELTEAGIQSGVLGTLLQSVADILEVVAQNAGLVVTAFLGFKAAALLQGLAGLIALSPPIAALTGVLLAAGAAIEFFHAAQVRANAAQTEAIRLAGNHATQTAALAKQFREQAAQLASGKLKGDQLKAAEERLAKTKKALIDLGGPYAKALQDGTQSLQDQVKAVNDLSQAERLALVTKAAAALQEAEDLQAQQELLALQFNAMDRSSGAAFEIQRQLKALPAQIKLANDRANALADAFNRAAAAAGTVAPPTIKGNGNGKATKGSANDLKQQVSAAERDIKAVLDAQTKELNKALDNGEISYSKFYHDLSVIQENAINAQIANTQRLLAATTDEGEKAQLLQKIDELEADRRQVQFRNNALRLEAERQLQNKMLEVQKTRLEQQGQLEQARLVELQAQFRDLINRLVGEGRFQDINLINQLFNVELAKTRAGQINQVIDRADQQLQNTQRRVELAQQAGALSQREAQEQLAQAYLKTADAIAAQLPALRANAAAVGTDNSAQLQQLTDAELKVIELRQAATQLRDRMREVREDLRQGTEQGFTTFLEEATDRTKHFTDALADLAKNLLTTIRNVANQQLAQAVTRSLFDPGKLLGAKKPDVGQTVADVASTAQQQALAVQQQAAATTLTAGAGLLAGATPVLQAGAITLSAGSGVLAGAAPTLGGAGGLLLAGAGVLQAVTPQLQAAASTLLTAAIILSSGAGGVGLARGGPVRGPGTGTSDSIPAWLSNGEFVVNARATAQHYETLVAMNRNPAGGAFRPVQLRKGAPRFSRGGLVADAQAGAAGISSSLQASVLVRLADGLIEDRMERFLATDRGAKATLNVLGANRIGAHDALRLRPGRG